MNNKTPNPKPSIIGNNAALSASLLNGIHHFDAIKDQNTILNTARLLEGCRRKHGGLIVMPDETIRHFNQRCGSKFCPECHEILSSRKSSVIFNALKSVDAPLCLLTVKMKTSMASPAKARIALGKAASKLRKDTYFKRDFNTLGFVFEMTRDHECWYPHQHMFIYFKGNEQTLTEELINRIQSRWLMYANRAIKHYVPSGFAVEPEFDLRPLPNHREDAPAYSRYYSKGFFTTKPTSKTRTALQLTPFELCNAVIALHGVHSQRFGSQFRPITPEAQRIRVIPDTAIRAALVPHYQEHPSWSDGIADGDTHEWAEYYMRHVWKP